MFAVSHWEMPVWMRGKRTKVMYKSCSYFKFLCSCLDIETLSLNQFSPRVSYWEFKSHSRVGPWAAVVGQHKMNSRYFESFVFFLNLTILCMDIFLKIIDLLLIQYVIWFCFYGLSVLSKCVFLSICMCFMCFFFDPPMFVYFPLFVLFYFFIVVLLFNCTKQNNNRKQKTKIVKILPHITIDKIKLKFS